MLQGDREMLRALAALGEKLDFSGCQPIALVICGGAALNIVGAVARPTKDIDVVALASGGPGAVRLEYAELPEEVRRCAREVAEDLGLGNSWLNTGPRELLKKGLPEGCEGRLARQDFGPRLRVYCLGRKDLVCMKVYAAAGRSRRPDVHRADLRALRPSGEELEAAIVWAMVQDDSDDFRLSLQRLLSDLGHSDLAYYI